MFILIPMALLYQNLPMCKQDCSLQKGKNVLKQCVNEFFRFKNMTSEVDLGLLQHSRWSTL